MWPEKKLLFCSERSEWPSFSVATSWAVVRGSGVLGVGEGHQGEGECDLHCLYHFSS